VSVRIYRNLNCLDRYSKNSQISTSVKIHPVGTELLDKDRQTDR